MPKKLIGFFLFFLLSGWNSFGEFRSFNDIFPDLSPEIQVSAFTNSGYIKSFEKSKGFVLTGSQRNAGINSRIINAVLGGNPGYLVESILVISSEPDEKRLIDVYNALGNIRALKGRLYLSHTRNQETPLFEDATRLVSDRNNTAVNDPPPAISIPSSETIFIRLKDVNFGNSYYRADMSLAQNSLLYRLSNYRNLTYFLFPVIREEKFVAQLYFELIQEGILVYSLAGADVSDFAASRVDMGSAISKRLAVIISWVVEGIGSTR
ncbi:MAG: hypothetical protein FWG99_03915 [Treponema sp.]|nr:hypothetical protein [Treponema sp.]